MNKASFPVQTSVVDALWRDPAAPTHEFSQHGLSAKVFTPYSVSLSLLFPRIFLRHHSETMLDEINDLISNQGSAALEAAALVGSGTNGVPLGILTEAVQAESAATTQSFSSSGNPTAAELQTMVETLGDQGAGLLSNECGFLVHPKMLTKLRALSDPSGKAPLLNLENGRIWALGLPVEVSSSMPETKVLLINAKHAVRLLVWEPTPDILIDEVTSRTAQVRVVATLYVNVFLNRTDLVIVGQ
jgi:HK97 family phage major capsid protein